VDPGARTLETAGLCGTAGAFTSARARGRASALGAGAVGLPFKSRAFAMIPSIPGMTKSGEPGGLPLSWLAGCFALPPSPRFRSQSSAPCRIEAALVAADSSSHWLVRLSSLSPFSRLIGVSGFSRLKRRFFGIWPEAA
jgi:hypothetical protein